MDGKKQPDFVCVDCKRPLPDAKLAYDTDPEHRLGLCVECEQDRFEEDGRSAWLGREVA